METPPTTAVQARAKAVLLEFLKFRVLAAEDDFFANNDRQHRRDWLSVMHPQSLVLTDEQLDQVWIQAHALYGSH